MKVHVTCVTNHRQDSVARMAQQMIADVGRQLGYEVCPIYTKYTTPHQEPDSLEELLKRLDDLGKKTAAGDAVIFQFPTWNHYTVDANLLSWLKSQQRRVIIFCMTMHRLCIKKVDLWRHNLSQCSIKLK